VIFMEASAAARTEEPALQTSCRSPGSRIRGPCKKPGSSRLLQAFPFGGRLSPQEADSAHTVAVLLGHLTRFPILPETHLERGSATRHKKRILFLKNVAEEMQACVKFLLTSKSLSQPDAAVNRIFQ
jgi:hypothetical protein